MKEPRCVIKRHGGRAGDRWIVDASGDDVAAARREFAELKKALRQGGLQLYIDGKVADQCFAARQSTRW